MHAAHSLQIGEARRFGLDLVRAIAITGVLAAHVGTFGMGSYGLRFSVSPGFLGVELFFVLSGFLIGGLLLDILDRGPSLRRWGIFLVRRWMRTVPLYCLWLVLLLLFFPPASDMLPHAVSYAMFSQNLFWPMPPGNWFGASWSLTIEEWFYLLFSTVLFGLAWKWPTRAVLWSCVVFMTLPLAARLTVSLGDSAWDAFVRKIVFLRLDAICYGVAGAVLYRRSAPLLDRWRWILLAAGCTLVVIAWQSLVPTGVMRGLIFNVTSLGFVLTFPAALRLRRPVGAVAGPVEWLSTRSYGLYIVHLTVVVVFARQVQDGMLPRWMFTAAVVVVCAAIAEFGYRFIELPILRARPRQFEARPPLIGSKGSRELLDRLKARDSVQ